MSFLWIFNLLWTLSEGNSGPLKTSGSYTIVTQSTPLDINQAWWMPGAIPGFSKEILKDRGTWKYLL